jgi:formylglycine-generating enzyme required for sulfatase activity
MVFVLGGTFVMGETKASVTISDFWMDATPVTVSQWRAYCAATGKSMPKDKPSWGWIDDHPMVNVSWHDASGYATWAGGRLPTSAEFEYAARDGGRNIAYPWGDTFDTNKLWCSIKSYGDAGKTAAVKRQDRIFVNSHGLSDMAGNVWQWCGDGPNSASRYKNGGAWFDTFAGFFRCADRGGGSPVYTNFDCGFRLCTGP